MSDRRRRLDDELDAVLALIEDVAGVTDAIPAVRLAEATEAVRDLTRAVRVLAVLAGVDAGLLSDEVRPGPSGKGRLRRPCELPPEMVQAEGRESG